jgi:serine/threonine protein kinase
MTERTPDSSRQSTPLSMVVTLPVMAELGLPPDIECIESIGVGGMGAVYKARNRRTGAWMAVKVLLPKHAADEKAVQRFVREANILAGISHRHIVSVDGAGVTANGLPYILMELLPGMPLDQCLAAGGPASPQEVIEVLSQCADALGHAHKRGIVHRDLKPSNIMININDRGIMTTKLLDFGICKQFEGKPDLRLTDTGQVLGTPLYMSPESVLGSELDGRSDIYSLGCLMHELLAGKPPFFATDAYKVLAQQIKDPAPDLNSFRSDIPPALKRIIERMMEKRCEDRYQSMDDLLKDLHELRESGNVPKRLTGRQKRLIKLAVECLIFALVGFAIAYAISLVMAGQGGVQQ